MEIEISLKDLIFYGYHGVLEEERKTGNKYKVSISVFIPCDGIREDNLKSTISYADLFEIVREEMSEPKNLLETLSIKIVERIKETFPLIIKGTVNIEKVHPPIPDMIGSASVTLHF